MGGLTCTLCPCPVPPGDRVQVDGHPLCARCGAAAREAHAEGRLRAFAAVVHGTALLGGRAALAARMGLEADPADLLGDAPRLEVGLEDAFQLLSTDTKSMFPLRAPPIPLKSLPRPPLRRGREESTMANATQTYRERRAEIDEKLAALKGALARHGLRAGGTPDWAAAGDLGHVAEQLGEILDFLGAPAHQQGDARDGALALRRERQRADAGLR